MESWLKDFDDFPENYVSNDMYAHVGLTVMGVSMLVIFICIILMFRDRKYRGIFKKMPKYIMIMGTCGVILNILDILWCLRAWDNDINFFQKIEKDFDKFNAVMILYYTILFAMACWNILKDYIILYYFYYYSDFSQNSWIKFINDDEMKRKLESKLHIRCRNKLGSFKFMFFISCALIFVYGIGNLICYIFINYWIIYSLTSFGIIVILYGIMKICIICRIPKFIDNKGFMKYQLTALVILIVAIAVSVVLYMKYYKSNNQTDLILFHLIMGSIVVALYLALVTGYTWCHSEKMMNNIPKNDDQKSVETTIEQSKTYMNISKIRMYRKGTYNIDLEYNFNEISPKSSTAERSDLELILLNSNGIIYFGEYLVKHERIEYLLAYIEFTQYQARCHKDYEIFRCESNNTNNNNNNNNDNNQSGKPSTSQNNNDNRSPSVPSKPIPHIPKSKKDITRVKIFAQHIPNSSIVWNDSLSTYTKAIKLYKQYIDIPPERNQLSLSDLNDSKDELKESLQGASTRSVSPDTSWIEVTPNTQENMYNILNSNYDDRSYEMSYVFNEAINEIYNKLWKLFQEFSQTKIGYNVIMQIKQIDSCEILCSSLHSLN